MSRALPFLSRPSRFCPRPAPRQAIVRTLYRFMHCAAHRLRLGALTVLTLSAFTSPAADPDDLARRLDLYKKMTLDELLDERVSLVSRTPTRWFQAPAAIQIVNEDEIRRSGATSLPEALRLAGNLHVAQNNSHEWAISARGFNSTFANKLLVMIDGRTIYTPLYGGVFWDVQTPLLDNIDRIEVISGPGGTLWGANAVNGVINIVTKSAQQTQGLYVSGAAGSMLLDHEELRYGGKLGPNLYYRVQVQHFDRNNTRLRNGGNVPDDWSMTQGGFRADWLPSGNDTITFGADFYDGREEMALGHTSIDGQNARARWTHIFNEESDFQAQFYFDRTWREIPGTAAQDLKTYDFDFQHRFPLGASHSILWGVGYRFMVDRVRNTPTVAFVPAKLDFDLVSGFLQDEITLFEDLKVTIGSKLEHNDFSGWEVQPSIRAAWTPTERQTVWGAVSRAVRSPSRFDRDLHIPAPPVPPGVPHLTGGPTFDSERVLTFELGYRIRPARPITASIALFYNFYDDLRSLTLAAPNTFVFGNDFEGETRGVELTADYEVTDWWRLRATYTYLHKDLHATGGPEVVGQFVEGSDPEHLAKFQSLLDLPGNLHLDLTGRVLSELEAPYVPGHFALDVRLAWDYRNLEVALVGQNVTDPEHPEFGAQEIPRSIYGRLTWRF